MFLITILFYYHLFKSTLQSFGPTGDVHFCVNLDVVTLCNHWYYITF